MIYFGAEVLNATGFLFSGGLKTCLYRT